MRVVTFTDDEAAFVAMVLMNWGADRRQCIGLADRIAPEDEPR